MRISDWSSDVCSSDLLLGTLFERLCTHGVPVGPNIFEITRLCLPPSLSRPERMLLRDGLIRAMVDHALDRGIHRFTGVVTAPFRQQLLGMGWHGEALGPGQDLGCGRLGDFVVTIPAAPPPPPTAHGPQAP